MYNNQDLKNIPQAYDNNNNNDMDNVTISDNRRKYPKDNKGIKDEWAALVFHQKEMYDQIQRHQKELKILQAKQLGNEYDKTIVAKIIEKQQEISRKQQESELMEKKLQEFQKAEEKVRLEKVNLQSAMARVYENSLEQRQKAIYDKKMAQLEEERRFIEEDKRKLEEENKKKLEKAKMYHEFVQKEQENYKIKKQLENEMVLKEREDYKELLKRNEEKNTMKEANYRNFYRMAAENQKQLEDIHIKSVLSPEIEKKKQMDNLVQKGIEENAKKASEREREMQQIRKQLTDETGNALKTQLTYKEYQNEMERLQKIYGRDEVLKQMVDYQSFLKFQKDKKYNQQAMYRDILDKQTKEFEELQKMNKMTKHEKKLNFDDLQAFKSNNPTLYTLLPGFQNAKAPGIKSLGKSYDNEQQLQQSNQINSSLLNPNLIPKQQQQQQSIQNLRESNDNYSSASNRNSKPEGTAGLTKPGNLINNNFDGINPSNDLNELDAITNLKGSIALNKNTFNEAYPSENPLINDIQGNMGAYGENQDNNYSKFNDNLANNADSNYQNPQINQHGNYNSASIQRKSNELYPESKNPNSDYINKGISGKLSSGINPYDNIFNPKHNQNKHNPLINPLPYNIQNPYILKELQKASARDRNYFGNIANNNLLNKA